jgi:hypothetical protein
VREGTYTISPRSGRARIDNACRLYVVAGTCVVRYDNESGKGDHRHVNAKERRYAFENPEQLIADVEADIARWNRENRNS